MFGAHPMFRIGGGGYQIANSLRFRASNSAYLTRTPAVAGNRKTATLSVWVKRGGLGSLMDFLGVGAGNTEALRFTAGNNLLVRFGNLDSTTNALFRDPSAWGHLLVARDTTQATSTDRLKVWWNNVALTFSSYSVPAQNSDTDLCNAVLHDIGRGGGYFDGYLANFYLIDGQALTPSSFGQTDATTGVWVPKAYSGTYGTNGFFLQFKDATSTTTIGYDTSGNSNNFTTSGISVTSGVTFDQMLDTPTNNYPVWSPIDKGTVTVSEANMAAVSAADVHAIRATVGLPATGKWYWEVAVSALGYGTGIGIADNVSVNTTGPSSAATRTYQFGSWFNSFNSGVVQYGTSQAITSATNWSGASQPAANDIIMVAVDMDNGSMWVGKNGTWFNSSGTANPATNTDPRWTSLTGTTWFPYMAGYGSVSPVTCRANFGQRAFSYTPPSGFKALSTANITSTAVSTSGSFTGNAAADGPFVWTNGNPATLTINGNGVTFGTDADKTAGGFKLRTSSASYNASGSNTWTATAGKRFVQSRKPNNAQVNP
jgi:hypothetical protein